MPRVQVRVSPELDAARTPDRPRPVIVNVALSDGRTLSGCVDIPTGLPEKPVNFEQVVRKYRDLAEPALVADTARQGATEVVGLERLTDVAELMTTYAMS